MKNLLLALFLVLPLAAKDSQPLLIATTAGQFLDSLDATQRNKAALPLAHDERENFRYTPRGRAGLPFKEMTEAQREGAKMLLKATLSEKGQLKVTQIMGLEAILAEIEKRPEVRDPLRYFVAIFGTPGDPKGWGWRFEGHHVSLNFTYVEGKKVSLTPSFFGTNPGEVRQGALTGLRILAAEEDLARTLVSSLVASGKNEVIFSPQAPAEILSGELRQATVLDPVGILSTALTEAQRSGLLQLISEYTGRYRKDLADADMAKIEAAGIDKIRFGWAGGLKLGEPYYYRIQGPTFLMEACNVQNNANHVHAVWRDFEGDFGRDLLGEHIKQEH